MEERDSEAGNEDKTEDPSEERRRRFREQGNIPSPKELAGALGFLTTVACLQAMGLSGWKVWGRRLFEVTWLQAPRVLDGDGLLTLARHVSRTLVVPLGLWSLILVAVPVAGCLALTRFSWTWTPLVPNFGRLNPVKGLGRLLGGESLLGIGRSFLKVVVLFAVMWLFLRVETQWTLLPGSSLDSALFQIGQWLSQWMWLVAGTMVVMGGAEYGFQVWRTELKMRMTKAEVKQELKSQEGDPLVKSRRRRLGREIAAGKNLSEVGRAQFVVTNPEHFAVAVRYVSGMAAPVVVSKGTDFLALRIREIAKKKDILIVENKPLARTLYKSVRVGGVVPASLYGAVIEVMKTVYRLRGSQAFDDVSRRAS